MRFQAFFCLAVTLCALPIVSAIMEAAVAMGAVQALIDDLHTAKTQLAAMQDSGIIGTLLGGVALQVSRLIS